MAITDSSHAGTVAWIKLAFSTASLCMASPSETHHKAIKNDVDSYHRCPWHRAFHDIPPKTFSKNLLSPPKCLTQSIYINTLPFLPSGPFMTLLPLNSLIFLPHTAHVPCWAPVSCLTKLSLSKVGFSHENLLPWISFFPHPFSFPKYG